MFSKKFLLSQEGDDELIDFTCYLTTPFSTYYLYIVLKIPKWINMSTMLHLLRVFEGTKADLQPN